MLLFLYFLSLETLWMSVEPIGVFTRYKARWLQSADSTDATLRFSVGAGSIVSIDDVQVQVPQVTIGVDMVRISRAHFTYFVLNLPR